METKNTTTASHTQGEWKIQEGMLGEDIRSEENYTIATVYRTSGSTEGEANAKRIVKAVNILSQIENYHQSNGYKINPKQDAVLEFIKELLKQAEGK